MTAAQTVPTVECRRCEVEVPAGNFCGLCGCPPAAVPGKSSVWLRRRVFGAAPGESVLRPHLASSLFPQLPTRLRTPLQVALAIGAAALMASALLRTPALGIAVGALGIPLLFAFYVRLSGADRDLPRAALVIGPLLGALLGAAWVLVAGSVVARNYGVPMSVGLALHHLLREGFIIPAVGMVLMVVPTLLIRMWMMMRPTTRWESLDGFMIGAGVALAFTAAATMTRLAPQVAAGLIAHVRPLQGLVIQAVLCGVTVPITGAAAGGMVGIALWFRPSGQHGRRVRLVLALLAVAALLAHAAVGVVDIVGLPQLVMLVSHVGMTVLILLGLRLSLQLALLHEVHDPVEQDQPLLCPYCSMVVPDMAFCPACGVATRATSQESRRQRRDRSRPVPASAGTYPGYALPSASYLTPELPSPKYGWLLSRWGIAIGAAAVTLAATALALTPKLAHYMCPPDCGKPPSGTPVMALPRFNSEDGSFTVSHPAPGSFYDITKTPNGVTATLTAGDGGVMQLFSERANGRSAKDVAVALLKRAYPDSKVAYEIPNAMVGYQPGYGVLADDWPQGATTGYSRVRILIMTAVKNDVALVAWATGPYHAFGPDFGPGQPSAANLQIAQDMGKYVNSFRWGGDPDR